ncbi:MAG: ABC transporter, partial [Longimicrobiales bacterium]
LRNDASSLVRDPLLGWVILLPIGLALLLRVLIPRAGEALLVAAGFDLLPYHPLIMSGYLLTAPGIVGMVIGFLLLDERDARTLDALRVTPLAMEWYLVYRLSLPLLLGLASTLVGYPLARLAPLPPAELVAITFVAGLTAPTLTLLLATTAPNKVAGFAMVKVVNTVNLLPVAAFFVPLPYQRLAGVLPTYWPMRALWSASAGAGFVGELATGLLVNLLAVALMARLFMRRLLERG